MQTGVFVHEKDKAGKQTIWVSVCVSKWYATDIVKGNNALWLVSVHLYQCVLSSVGEMIEGVAALVSKKDIFIFF